MNIRLVSIALFVILQVGQSFAQCSDAGVCSLGHAEENPGHVFSFGYAFGRSSRADDITFHSVKVGADIRVADGSVLSLGTEYNSQSGPLGDVSGIGDATLTWTQSLVNTDDERLLLQLGAKFALGKDDEGKLPQAYQSGLGTNDLLAGVKYEMDGWSFAAGYQHPFGRSKNSVDRLKRGADLMGRIGYTHAVGELEVGGDILFIRRISRSSVLSATAGGAETFVDLPGSNQSQVNIIGRGVYPLSELTTIRVSVAVPLLKRKVNVDGLTRSITLSIGLSTSI
jgi:hypothetical protein